MVFAARHDRRIGFKSIACPAEHWLELAARHLTPVANNGARLQPPSSAVRAVRSG